MSLDKGCIQKIPSNANNPKELHKLQKMAGAQHSLGAEGALLLQLPVPEDGSGWWDSIDSACERLRRAVLVGVNGGQQCILADLWGDWKREKQVTPPANSSPMAPATRVIATVTNSHCAALLSVMQSTSKE